jgi:hypothetical protein
MRMRERENDNLGKKQIQSEQERVRRTERGEEGTLEKDKEIVIVKDVGGH